MIKKYTDEEREFIQNNYKGISTRELTERFNLAFGEKITEAQMKGYKGRYKLWSGVCNRFQKGHVPNNKGKKMSREMYEKAHPTMFKKGNVPVNYRPVGSERVNVDGYIEIKVADPNKWLLKHRVVYEREIGEIPKDSAVFFLDGDKQNCELSNLKLVKRSELLIMNRYHLFQNNAELNDAASNLARMIHIANSKNKERKEKC